MQNAYRIGATFETIPTELKLMIAAHLDPDVPNDLRWSEMAHGEARVRRPAVRSLSLVSRSWATALEDLRWQVRRSPHFVPLLSVLQSELTESCWTDFASSCCRHGTSA